jgi:hypothetical protein
VGIKEKGFEDKRKHPPERERERERNKRKMKAFLHLRAM